MTHKISIKLVKSLIGRHPKHITIANQLGLRKMNAEVIHKDIPEIRGLVNQIQYMVSVKEASE